MAANADAPVLVVNCGSSSVEADLVTPDERRLTVVRVDRPLDDDRTRATVAAAVTDLPELSLVAHRLVHGGEQLQPTAINDAELARLNSLTRLAPLHLPPAIAAAELVRSMLPDVAAYACFDTEFHNHLAPASRTLPVPARWRDEHGIHRYGFHGPGHHWAMLRTAELLDQPLNELQAVTVHIGGGVSAAAIRDGHSIDTTMGFTPLAGMAMSTRPGSLDPGVLLEMLATGSPIDQLEHDINNDSGLAGLADGRSDLRDLYPAANAGDEQARLALDVYVTGIAQGIASMATDLDRVDAIAFTGGAGWGSARLRSEVCTRLAVLGVHIDTTRNHDPLTDDALIQHDRSPVAVAAVRAQEAAIIARSALAAHHQAVA